MENLKSYSQVGLASLEGVHRSRIKKDKDLYIPVQIETAQTRATARGYSVRYIRAEDVKKYIRENENNKSGKKSGNGRKKI